MKKKMFERENKIEDGYTTATIHYHWCSVKEPDCKKAVRVEENIELPSYRFAHLCVNQTVATTASGSYSRLWVQFSFERESGFYMLQIFVPATLVVFISWVSFWINRDSAPSRTVIGTMTILSETHLLTGTNRRLPPVSYIKAVDVYLGFCYLIVSMALIEYACVAYATKKHNDQMKKFRKREETQTQHQQPQLQTPDLLRDARIDECTCEQGTSILATIAKRPFKLRPCVKHSRIDLIARFVFPISFLLFNFIYWIVLLSLAGWLNTAAQEAEDELC
uniref:Glutamate-gated chloride channel n=1 Tax=Ascaris suum TaxID=6253 RepID=F1LCC3_ASCSU